MPPACLVSGLRVPSKTPPKMTPDMSRQLNSSDAETMASAISSVICGTMIEPSEKSPPFTYGNADSSSSMYSSRPS